VKNYTAATKLGTAAQKAMNLAQAASPAGLVVAGLAAITAAVMVYAATHKSALSEITEAYEDEIKSIDDSTEASIKQLGEVEHLREKLFFLEKQLKSGTNSQETANKMQEEFRSTANELNSIIPGITNNLYSETGAINIQRDAVIKLTNAYIALKTAQITGKAWEQKALAASEGIVKIEYEIAQKKENGDRMYNINLTPTPENPRRYVISKEYQDLFDKKASFEKELDFSLTKVNESMDEVQRIMKESGLNIEEDVNKTSNTVNTSVSKGAKNTTDKAKETQKALKEAREKEFRDLKFQLSTNQITEEKYYQELAKLRDKYFEKGSEEWQNYTLEIYDYTKEATEKAVDTVKQGVSKMKDEALAEIDEMQEARKTFADKLSSQKLYETLTIHSGDGTKTLYRLNDYAEELKQLELFDTKLENVTGRLKDAFGDDTEGLTHFLDELRADPFGEGKINLDVISFSTQEELQETVKGWQELRKRATETAAKSYENDAQMMKEAFTEKFGELPEDFFGLGSDAGEKFGKAFVAEAEKILAEAKASIQSSLGIYTPLWTVEGLGKVNTTYYSSTYNVLPSKGESTQAQLQAIHYAETYNKASGGY